MQRVGESPIVSVPTIYLNHVLIDHEHPSYAEQIPPGTDPDSVHLKPVLDIPSEKVSISPAVRG